MTLALSDLQVLIGGLCNDPNYDRYNLTQIGTELDNSQNAWNVKAKILKSTKTLTVVAGTRQYAITLLSGVPISFPRATHKGIPLHKRDKTYFDLYAGSGLDWTTLTGTPTDYLIEATDPANQYVTVFPAPTSADAGANLVIEFILAHTPMAATTDTPFNASPEMAPYNWGLAYDVASRLLIRDPNPLNAQKVSPYKMIADGVLDDVVTVFKALEKQEPMRVRSNAMPIQNGGMRSWRTS